MIKSNLKIAYLSSETPLNKRVWSGTHHSIYQVLCGFGEVVITGPYEPKIYTFIGKVANQIGLLLFGKRFDYRHSVFVSKAYGSYFNKKIKSLNPDIIVAPAASTELAYLETTIPIIYITDGTFSSCLNYHTVLSNLWAVNIRSGNALEKAAIHKCQQVIVSSDWAAESVIHTYSKAPEQVKVMPFGANFNILPTDSELNFEPTTPLKLLFVGVYWENKGGPIAFNAFKKLTDKGYKVSLTVLGCVPPIEFEHPAMTVIPFIDKNNAEGQKKLFEIYKSHHLLLLPTRFDCTPIVINEASAFGIPCLVADTGGVKGHLHEPLNGYLIAYTDLGEAYATKIEMLIKEPNTFLELRKRTRVYYIEKLNWDTWAQSFEKIISEVL